MGRVRAHLAAGHKEPATAGADSTEPSGTVQPQQPGGNRRQFQSHFLDENIKGTCTKPAAHELDLKPPASSSHQGFPKQAPR